MKGTLVHARRLYALLAGGTARFDLTFAAFLAAVTALPAGDALAEDAAAELSYDDLDDEPLLPVRLDGHASLTWDGYVGVGARVDIPVLKRGLAYSTKDELAISVGADVIFASFDNSDVL